MVCSLFLPADAAQRSGGIWVMMNPPVRDRLNLKGPVNGSLNDKRLRNRQGIKSSGLGRLQQFGADDVVL